MEVAVLVQAMINKDDVASPIIRCDDIVQEELQVADSFWVSVAVAVYYQGG